jgi:GT2 family glycosyltransferase/glycosyltransferase involved in cell wall biosynthesis
VARLDLAVIVVTYQSRAIVPACLAALPDALQGVGSWDLLVVDNGSTDGTPALVADLVPEATVIEMGRNAGYAAAINTGVRATDAAAVLVLNPDIRLEPGAAVALLDALDRPGVGISAPRLVDERGGLQLSLRREPSVVRAMAEATIGGRRASRTGRLGEIIGDPARYDAEQPVDWASGAALAISRACLDAVGPWDESYFLYSEETDFALRSRDAGFSTWYTPAARGVHLGGESNTSPRLWSRLTLNRVELFRSRHGRLASMAFRMAVLANELIRAATGSPTHRAASAALLGRNPDVPDAEPASPPGAVEVPPPTAEPPWVCFSSVDWWYHNRAHSDIQLMRRIADQRRVLFVNSIGMRMPLPGRSTQSGRRILRKARSMLRLVRRPLADTPGFHVATPFVIPFYGSRGMRALNARLVRAQVQVMARLAGIDLADAVVVVTVPTAWEVAEAMPRRSLVMNRSDLHSSFEETDQGVIRALEDALLERSDLVLYAAHSLMDAEAAQTGERSHFLDHGVDLDHFGGDVGPEPADLATIAHPRIGFFGGIDDYVVDLDLLERVATSIPDASLVLIGDATCPMDALEALPNVHWLGFRPYEQIPAYGAGFDVALMPWLRNDWIQSSNPIKLKEYLALGLPVVSTEFPEVHHYADCVAIARDADDFVELIREALDGRPVGTPARRRARVAGATWDGRADELLELGEGATR